jgi:hypothetical protein
MIGRRYCQEGMTRYDIRLCPAVSEWSTFQAPVQSSSQSPRKFLMISSVSRSLTSLIGSDLGE